MSRLSRSASGALACAVLCAPLSTLDAQRWGVGGAYHLNWGGPGSRAGDVPGYGLTLRRQLGAMATSPWEAALSVDRFEYDLETPIHATSVDPPAGDPPVDAFTTVLRTQVDVVRRYRMGRRWTPYLSAGAGLYLIDVPDITGNTSTGGTFVLRTESPTTGGISAGAGSEWRIVGGLTFTLAAAWSQTFTKYEVTELRTGERGTISPFAPLGLTTRIDYRW